MKTIELNELKTKLKCNKSTADKDTRISQQYKDLAKNQLLNLSKSDATCEELQLDLLKESVQCIELQDELSNSMKWMPRVIKKECWPNSTGCSGVEAWHEWIVLIISELLSDCTQPSCIPASILTVAESLHPNGASWN